MDTSKLTEYQLYELIQNSKLDNEIRNLANAEFNSRNLVIDRIQEVVQKHDLQFPKKSEGSLRYEFKILLVLLPFFIPIQSLFATKWLATGEKRKW